MSSFKRFKTACGCTALVRVDVDPQTVEIQFCRTHYVDPDLVEANLEEDAETARARAEGEVEARLGAEAREVRERENQAEYLAAREEELREREEQIAAREEELARQEEELAEQEEELE